MFASTLTAGDDWSTPEFDTTKVIVTALLAAGPPDAAVKTKTPGICVHTAVAPSCPEVDVTLRDGESGVCNPVSPVIVTVDPSAKSKFAVSIIVSVLLAPETGELCSIDLTMNRGTKIFSGL